MNRLMTVLLVASAGCATAAIKPDAGARPAYPESRRGDDADTLNGVRVADPYRWLEDEKSPEVQAWMKAQDDFARAQLGKLPRREAIAARLKELMYLDRLGAPTKRGSRLFLSKRSATQEKAVVYFKEVAGGDEKVLLDPNAWAADGSASLGAWAVTWDGKRVAYVVRRNNSDEGELHVMEIDSLKESDVDRIPGMKFGGPSWNADGSGFFYTWMPTDKSIPVSERQGFAEIRFHKLGEAPAGDKVWREKLGNPTNLMFAQATKDGHWLVLDVEHGSASSNDLYLRDLRLGAEGTWVPVVVDQAGHYSLDVYRDRLYIETNDGAPRGRLFSADAASPARAGWQEIVPQHGEDVLQSVSVVGGKLALGWLHDVASRLEVRNLDGSLVREQPLPGRGSASGLFGDEDDDDAYFAFTSYTTPNEIQKTSITSGETSLYFRLKVPVDPAQLESTQVFYLSKDGTRVPLWLVYKKGLAKDGKAPALLEGYGGFRISLGPSFSPNAIAWVEQGGVYAVANLRGGGEYGEEWHKAGMLDKKQNVFDDMIGAAEYLIKEGYTSAGRLTAQGGSNGGLLMGAIETQRPELFGAILCGVPLLDMVRYPKFGVARFWVPEYGDPNNAAQLQTLLAYSPYHRVKEGTRYPATLLDSADSDDRVDPMHARKFAAELQHATTGGPVLLRIERHSGHGGADLIRATVERMADQFAFALDQAAGEK